MEKTGLSEHQVLLQRSLHGWNTTDDDEYVPESLFSKMFEQLCNPLIGLLLLSAGVSLFLRQFDNAVGILVAVGLVGVVGAVQEAKTEAILEALKQLSPARTHVIREGVVREVAAKELVVGDVVEIRAGDRVPGDLEIDTGNDLMVDESVLNGESIGRSIGSGQIALMGCTVCRGWGRGTVKAVGKSTKFGGMVGLIKDAKCNTKTPLQCELDNLAHKLTIGSGVLIVLISVFTLFASPASTLMEVVTTAVSLAVAAIPEGLPLVSTVTMALAVRRLAKRGVIVKKMSSVEAMGGCRVVCFDKTGTLTLNSLSVSKFAFEEALIEEREFLRLAASCTDVNVTDRGEFIGNALDVCLVKHFGLEGLSGKTESVLFSSEKRFMQVSLSDGRTVGKGAVEAFDRVPEQYSASADEWSSSGLRVIGVGVKSDQDGGFDLYGLIGFQDTLRMGAKNVIQQLSSLSITPVMLTGDSEGTAGAVARALQWPNLEVHSRQTPHDKLAHIDRLQKTAVTIMIGDGVNDGAAVRRAQVGIAMGGSGSTDVARQAADIILSGDRLEGIVEAVLEGRAICINVQRFLGFQLSCSITSLLLVAVGSVTLKRLSPLHLLLLNIVMDGPPAQSLAMSHVPPIDLLSPPTIRLLDLRRLAECSVRGALVAVGCVYYAANVPNRTLLPPLLVLSMCNAYSWSADWRNRYLFGCLLCTLAVLLSGRVFPAVGSVIGAGQLGAEECLALATISVLFMLVVINIPRLPRLSAAGYIKI